MKHRSAPWILMAPFLVLFIGTIIVPILMTIGYSFTTVERSGLLGEKGATARFAGLDNYLAALFLGLSFDAVLGWETVGQLLF